MSSHRADPETLCSTDSRAAGDFTVDVSLTSQTCLDVRKTKKQGCRGSFLTLTPIPAPPPPPMFWPCDKCFKLVLIMRVTEEEIEASADRQDEWSIYFGWFQ